MAAWDSSLATAVVTKLVFERAPKFRPFRDIGQEDLISECMTNCKRAWKIYSPSRGAPSTFLWNVTHRFLLFRLRTLARRDKRERRGGTMMALAAQAKNNPVQDDIEQPETRDRVEWLGNIYRTIRRNFSLYQIPLRLAGKPGRPATFDRAQAAALLAFKRHYKLTNRGCEMLLRMDENLCRIIQLPRVPDHSFFDRIEQSVPSIDFRPSRVA